jgi:hypothetical protein
VPKKTRSFALWPVAVSVTLFAFAIVWMVCGSRGSRATVCRDETYNLRMLAQFYVFGSSRPLAADGRLDIYAALLDEPPSLDLVGEVCTDPRTGNGPTLKAIEAGDYTNFPYQRYRGRLGEDADPVPVLWEPRGTRKGGRLVAFSDGSVSFCSDPEADEIFRRNPGQE